MARTGLDKSDVKMARDGILAQSLYPSVDAVRIALGNTGSKTTIHKYLKELEVEEGGGPHQSSVSEALHDLVERLAARLAEEAEERVTQADLEFARKEQAHAETRRQLEAELFAERASTRTLESRLETEVDEHAKMRAALQAETVARHTAAQEAAGLKDRLAENEQHRQSLEDKHTQARNALEQYRLSVKEQRDKDQRRHEHQIEQLKAEVRQQQLALGAKQEELSRLNQEGARVAMELSQTKQSLYEQLTNGRKLERKIEQLQATHMHASDIERQLVSKIAEAELLTEQLKNADAQLEPAKARAREFELLLAQTTAKVEAQEQIGEQLRAYLDKLGPGVAAKRAR
jgi:DNA repair exonuclease SbcCD ATPase subunit